MISRRIGFRLQLITTATITVLVPLFAVYWYVSHNKWLLAAAGILIVWVTLVFWWFGHRMSKQISTLESSSHRFRREDENAKMPVLYGNQELFSLSLGLKNMVKAFQERQRKLEEGNAVLNQQVAERTQELNTMSDISRTMTASSEEAALLHEMLCQLQQALDYSIASIWSRGEDGVQLLHYRRAGEEQPDPKWLEFKLLPAHVRSFEQIERELSSMVVNVPRKRFFRRIIIKIFGDRNKDRLYQDTRSWMAVPLLMKQELLGVLRLDHPRPNFFNAERKRLLTAIGYQAALAIQHSRLSAQSQQMAVFHERNRIARDLHDAVSQSLFASNMTAETLSKNWANAKNENAHTETQRQLEELQRLNRGALAEMRLLLYELRPDALEHASLAELLGHAVNAAASRNNLSVVTEMNEKAALPSDIKLELYRIAQEAINNIIKHSQAKNLRVELETPSPDRCMLQIVDDGAGFVASEGQQGHFGLRNMNDRASSIGAKFELVSKPGKGTQITLIWQERGAA